MPKPKNREITIEEIQTIEEILRRGNIAEIKLEYGQKRVIVEISRSVRLKTNAF